MHIIASDRYFCLWDYCVSHSQLLIRSAKSEADKESRNVDIVFSGVFYMDSILQFRGIEVRNASPTEVLRIQSRTRLSADDSKGRRYFTILSEGQEFCVGAAHCKVYENNLHPADSSLDFG